MHIVVVAVSAAETPSGVCRHAVNLAMGVAAQPEVERVTVLAGAWQIEYLRRSLGLSGGRIEVLPVAAANTPLARNLWYLTGLPQTVKRLRADGVHLSFPMPVLRCCFAVPLAATLHDLYPFDSPGNFSGRAWRNRAALRLCLRSVHAIACVSASTEERLRKLYPHRAGKSLVVPNAVARRRAAVCAELPQEVSGRPFVLCVAQHRANKNLAGLVDAFAWARAAGVIARETRLVIVGRHGPETREIQRRAGAHGLEGAVLLLQGLSDEALHGLYLACEMVVAPSLAEGFGLPVAEALSVGCRVVCSDIAAFREVGGDACVYFDVQDRSGGSLLRAMQQALTSPRRPAAEFLTPEEIGRRYCALYSRLLMRQAEMEQVRGRETTEVLENR